MNVSTSTRRALYLAPLVALAIPLGSASCVGTSQVDDSESAESDAQDISASSAISRAEEWVSVKLHYCQSPNHERDYDASCSTYCERHDNSSWDPYRSDCSGLVSWAWGLPAPGRTTYGFAPFDTSVTHAISAIDLEPGDAVNNSEHVMLFKEWISKGHTARLIEEPGCSSSTPYAHEVVSNVSINGSSIYVSYNGMTFTSIRYHAISSGPPPAPADPLEGDRVGVSSWASGRLDLFARDHNNHLSHKYYTDSKWSGWQDLGGTLASAPAAASWAENRIDVFAQETSHGLGHTWWDGTWHGWENLGGTLTSAPTVVSGADRSLDVFARDENNHLVHKYYRDGTDWSEGFEDLGGNLAATPAAASWTAGRLDVFARDTNDNILHIYFDSVPHTWSAWETIHGGIANGPAVTSWGLGRLDLFAVGNKGELMHRWFDNGMWSSSDWEDLHGTLVSPPTGVSWGVGRIDVFARGGSEELVHRYYDSSGWSGWVHEGKMP